MTRPSRSLPVAALAPGAVLAFLAGVALGALGVPLARPVGALALLAVHGPLVLTLAGVSPRRETRWVVYAVGLSVVAVMVVGFLVNGLLPRVGIARPLRPATLGVAHVALALALGAAVHRIAPVRLRVPDARGTLAWARRAGPTPFLLATLPSAAVLAVELLNRGGGNALLVALLFVLALVPAAAATGVLDERWFPLAAWAVGLALLYHKTFWRFYRFSGQGNVVTAWRLGRWSVTERGVAGAATPLLPNVTLPSTVAHLGGITAFTHVEVVGPLVVSVLPVTAYAAFDRAVERRSREAFVGALVVAFVHPFYFQLPSGTRAAMPVVFLALFGLVVLDDDLPTALRKLLGLVFAASLVVSHYGAAYFVMAGIASALVLYAALRVVDERVGRVTTDGGVTARAPRQLSVTFGLFYVAATLSWYMYTFDGKKFYTLLEHAVTSLSALLAETGEDGAAVSGGTLNRLTKSYSLESVLYSKLLYIVLAGLVAVGLAWTYYRRFTDERYEPQREEFLLLVTGLLGVFGLSFVSPGAWGGGRPMILTFAVVAVFAVVGGRAGARVTGLTVERLSGWRRPALERAVGRTAVAVLLAGLLLLNTGAAAVAIGGFAPSNVPLDDRIATSDRPTVRNVVYHDTDLAAYAWLDDTGTSASATYADPLTFALANDFLSPQMAATTDLSRPPFGTEWERDLTEVDDDPRRRYVLLSGHNVEMGVFLDALRPSLGRADRIYTTGSSAVYWNGTARRPG